MTQPKDSNEQLLLLCLTNNQLTNIYTKLIKNRIDSELLTLANDNDIDELCKELNISIIQKLKLKRAIKQFTNHNRNRTLPLHTIHINELASDLNALHITNDTNNNNDIIMISDENTDPNTNRFQLQSYINQKQRNGFNIKNQNVTDVFSVKINKLFVFSKSSKSWKEMANNSDLKVYQDTCTIGKYALIVRQSHNGQIRAHHIIPEPQLSNIKRVDHLTIQWTCSDTTPNHINESAPDTSFRIFTAKFVGTQDANQFENAFKRLSYRNLRINRNI